MNVGPHEPPVPEFEAPATLILNAAVAVCTVPLESLAFVVKLKRPVADGVPEIAPVEENWRPAGSCPEAMDHL